MVERVLDASHSALVSPRLWIMVGHIKHRAPDTAIIGTQSQSNCSLASRSEGVAAHSDRTTS
jgi:hypothetical protein